MSATITTSIITGGSNSHATTSFELNAFATDFVSQGVVGSIANTLGVAPSTGGFAVNAQGTPAMLVDVTAGSAWITATPSGQASQTLRAYMSANYLSYAISSNASGSTKYDWIYLKVDPAKAGGTEDAAADDVTALYTSRSSSNTVDNNAPPTYGILLAIVTVANGASSITNANILDSRSQATPSAQVSASGTGWSAISTPPTSVTANGNRSYSLVFNGTDLTGSISPGMRIQTTRTVTSPTQCTSLNGSTQFYSKTSPAGMTFVGNFTTSAWIKLTSYGTQVGIIGRDSAAGTLSGWEFGLNSSGQVYVYWRNASGTTNLQTYQSVPLNKWVHVAAAATVATPTAVLYMDGVLVPSTSTATGATSVVQAATNLTIGNRNSASGFFPGSLAQVAVYSAAITGANILATISQGLAGTETSLISAYSFNNSINDLNANANNLTANGSAVATNADSPFSVNSFGTATGTTDYGIITKATFSTNTTLVVQVPEANAIPTSGGVSAVSYATVKTPYGFPAQRGKWTVKTISIATASQSSPTQNTWYNIGNLNLNIPIGEWVQGYETMVDINKTGSGTFLNSYATLSTTNNAAGALDITSRVYMTVNSAVNCEIAAFQTRRADLSLSAATIYYLNYLTDSTGIASIGTQATSFASVIFAECAYL